MERILHNDVNPQPPPHPHPHPPKKKQNGHQCSERVSEETEKSFFKGITQDCWELVAKKKKKNRLCSLITGEVHGIRNKGANQMCADEHTPSQHFVIAFQSRKNTSFFSYLL